MAVAAKIDLIRMYCGGIGKRFAEVACDFYIQLTSLCRLLEEETIGTVFSKGRCKPNNIVNSAVKRNLNRYKDRIGKKNFENYIKTIPVIVFERIKKSRLKTGFNLPTLIGYIRKTVYCETIQALVTEDIFVRKNCGNCVSLSLIRPYICQNRGSANEGNNNQFFNKERKRNDKPCDHFEKVKWFADSETIIDGKRVNIFETIRVETKEIAPEESFLFNDMRKLLKKRISETKNEINKKIFKRHYSVIVNLYHYLSEGYSIQKAKQMIADGLAKNVKTIDRDLKEIREYLSKDF